MQVAGWWWCRSLRQARAGAAEGQQPRRPGTPRSRTALKGRPRSTTGGASDCNKSKCAGADAARSAPDRRRPACRQRHRATSSIARMGPGFSRRILRRAAGSPGRPAGLWWRSCPGRSCQGTHNRRPRATASLRTSPWDMQQYWTLWTSGTDGSGRIVDDELEMVHPAAGACVEPFAPFTV